MSLAPGDQVEVVATDDPYTRLRPGNRGTVTGVREFPEPAIDVQWDDGSTLSVLPGAGDHITKLPGDPTGTPPVQQPHRQPPPVDPPGSPASRQSRPATRPAAPPPTRRRFLPPPP